MDTSGEFDTGPLTWVKGEIDLALARTIDALRAATATDEAATAEPASRQTAIANTRRRGSMDSIACCAAAHLPRCRSCTTRAIATTLPPVAATCLPDSGRVRSEQFASVSGSISFS